MPPLTQRANRRKAKDEKNKQTQFLIVPKEFESSFEEYKIEQCKVRSPQKHKQHRHIFNSRRVEISNVCRVRRKSPRSDGRKTVVDGVEGVHTTDSIGNGASNSDKQIRAPEIVRRGVDA